MTICNWLSHTAGVLHLNENIHLIYYYLLLQRHLIYNGQFKNKRQDIIYKVLVFSIPIFILLVKMWHPPYEQRRPPADSLVGGSGGAAVAAVVLPAVNLTQSPAAAAPPLSHGCITCVLHSSALHFYNRLLLFLLVSGLDLWTSHNGISTNRCISGHMLLLNQPFLSTINVGEHKNLQSKAHSERLESFNFVPIYAEFIQG